MPHAPCLSLSLLLLFAGTAFAQAPILAGTADHGLPGATPGTERWIAQFTTRSFELDAFRTAIMDRRPAAEVEALVRDMERRVVADQLAFTTAVEALGGKVVRQWWLVNAAAFEIAPDRLLAVRNLPNIALVQPDEARAPHILTSTNAQNHNADALQAVGFRGQGAAIGVMDSGHDSNVGGLGRPHRTYFVNGDPNNLTGGGIGGSRLRVNRQIGAMSADDVVGHGTSVTSICAGAHWGTGNADSGHAPLASIAGYAIAELPDGSSTTATMASGWQQMVSDRANFGIVAANLSYAGSPSPLDVGSQALDSAAWNADILCCVSAGNTGASTANSCSAANGLAVAAVTTNAHAVASFSARGPLSGDAQRTYPDIAACGVNTVMALVNNEAGNSVASGTSMSSPQVSGAAVQLRARFPLLTALQTKAVLLASCTELASANPGLGRNDFGAGFLRNDRAHSIADGNRTGTAFVSTTTLQHNQGISVQAGVTYQIAITWYRQNLGSTAWSNLDLAAIAPGGAVLAQSNSQRNLYEVLRVTPTFTGTMTIRTTGLAFSPGNFQVFAWAWTVDPYAGNAVAFGTGCAPIGSQINGAGGTLAPLLQPFEIAYSMGNWPGGQLVGYDVFTGSTGASPNLITAVYGNTGGVINTSSLALTTMTIGPVPGFRRATLATPLNLPPGPFWISVDHRAQTTYLSNLTGGVIAPCFQRPNLLSGAWTPSAAVVRPSIRVFAQSTANGGIPLLAASGTPLLGSTVTFNLTRAPANTFALLALGLSNTAAPFGPLPFPLDLAGAPACSVLTSSDVLDVGITNGTGVGTGSWLVPNLPLFVSQHIYAQYVTMAPTANALGLTFSNGIDMLVGY